MYKLLTPSFLDDDLYKFNMGSVVFHDFPQAEVTYQFINRGKTEFPKGFVEALNWQLEALATLSMTRQEYLYMLSIGMRQTYVEWLMSYRFDPGEVAAVQSEGEVGILIKGKWFRTILWEVRLMAIISELYFKMTGKLIEPDSFNRMWGKAERMSEAGCKWVDYGTRRRFSFSIQDRLVAAHKEHKGFLGTSNVYLAMRHNVKAFGTSAHEMVQGMSALYGVSNANTMWAKHWSDHFRGANGIALTDTFTTEVFLRDWDGYWARLFDGVRQDSGSPHAWMGKMMMHYQKLGIDARNKKFIFSDGLDADTFIRLTNDYKDMGQIIGGIGTNLTNDCGHKPLNMVIKLQTADFGKGLVDVVKLSDSEGKHTGTPEAIALVKSTLGI